MLRPILLGLLISGAVHAAAQPPLLEAGVAKALAEEMSGESAKRNLEVISGFHRMRASRGFHGAAEFIARRLRDYGLEDVEILEFPADGKTMFGTQKSRPMWDVESAELWELSKADDEWSRALRIGDWQSMPLTLAQDSESADVTADLVDVGAGTEETDYAGKDVRGRLVLTSSQPEAMQALAVERYGAAGIVSYAQNQRTAWWGEDENLVRWGHLDSFSPTRTFAFMVTLKQARAWQSRLAAGEAIRLEAHVAAGRHPGHYDIVTARIAGRDPALADNEIAFSCHLDHPHPGANDNASGCATILEVARTYAKLIREGRLGRPARSLRFIWPPEIEGTTILLNARPAFAARIAAVVHMDMVGGGPVTKAVFHVTRSPASLPTFVNDVAEAFAEFVNAQSLAYASGEAADYPLVAPEGGKEALLAVTSDFSMGSDHEVYTDGAFRIPAIYLNDWPDRYIHTNYDLPANIDPTKLKRAGFIGAASAWYLANLDAAATAGLATLTERHQLARTAEMLARRADLTADDAAALARFHWAYEQGVIDSVARFAPAGWVERVATEQRLHRLAEVYGPGSVTARAAGEAAVVYRRNADPKGPMSVFGYDYFTDHYGRERAAKLGLLDFDGARGDGESYAYEALNFVDGKRSVGEIGDALSAEFGPVPVELVGEYLAALAEIGVLRR
jgi:aminopeptidase YwaD